jgi:hypothetical protein
MAKSEPEWRGAVAMKERELEIRERALALLGVDSIHDREQIRRNFRRQIRLVNPDRPNALAANVPGFSNAEVARLLIQAYGHLTRRNSPTTMLEDDALVGTLLDGQITPISQTTTCEQWHAHHFDDLFRPSSQPDPSVDRELKYKFKGIC